MPSVELAFESKLLSSRLYYFTMSAWRDEVDVALHEYVLFHHMRGLQQIMEDLSRLEHIRTSSLSVVPMNSQCTRLLYAAGLSSSNCFITKEHSR